MNIIYALQTYVNGKEKNRTGLMFFYTARLLYYLFYFIRVHIQTLSTHFLTLHKKKYILK